MLMFCLAEKWKRISKFRFKKSVHVSEYNIYNVDVISLFIINMYFIYKYFRVQDTYVYVLCFIQYCIQTHFKKNVDVLFGQTVETNFEI